MMPASVFHILLLAGFGAIAIRQMNTNNRKKLFNIRRVLIGVLLVFMLTVILAFASYYELATLKSSLGIVNISGTVSTDAAFYGIMFDAGSTGSRVHVFKFQHSTSGDVFSLVEELFKSTQPGLSAYADNPQKGAESLQPLLEAAVNYIPQSKWRETPIALKATAGLRLLSNETAAQILKEVRTLFAMYEFKLGENGVSLLEGTDEGLFCWFTVNFLHGLLGGGTGSTLGMLDLGGGSTQITFLSSPQVTMENKQHLVDVKLFGRSYTLYSRSYLGLGMNSVRFQAIGGREVTGGIVEGTYRSPCLPDNYNGTWSHGGHIHVLRNVSKKKPKLRFHSCYAMVRRVLQSYSIDRVTDFAPVKFCAMSFYVDRAIDTHLVDNIEGGTITVDQYFQAALKNCENVPTDDPFLCLDLCYISALLHDGFGFSHSTPLLLRKQVNRTELAWPLGAMFDVYGQFNRL